MPSRRLLPCWLTLLATAGCATLFNSGQRAVAFSSNPTEAEVWIDGTRRGTTPISLELNNHRDATVTFRKEGHRDVVCELTAEVGAGWVILDVLGGLIPVIVDAATGKWRSLNSSVCNVNLPAIGGTSADSTAARRNIRSVDGGGLIESDFTLPLGGVGLRGEPAERRPSRGWPW